MNERIIKKKKSMKEGKINLGWKEMSTNKRESKEMKEK